MRIFPAIMLATASLLVGNAAVAADKCTFHPRSKWIAIDKAIEKAESLGYQVREVEADDNCWEVEGFDRNGAKIKLYLDPLTADVVQQER